MLTHWVTDPGKREVPQSTKMQKLEENIMQKKRINMELRRGADINFCQVLGLDFRRPAYLILGIFLGQCLLYLIILERWKLQAIACSYPSS